MAKGTKNKFQAALEMALARSFCSMLQRMPLERARRFGGSIGTFFHDVIGVRKKHAIQELLKAFPEQTETWAKKTTRNLYRHFGMLAVEMLHTPRIVKNNFAEGLVVDPEVDRLLKKAFEKGKGAVIASGHLGNWEIAGAYPPSQGYPVHFVVGEQSNSGIEALLDEYRNASGIQVIKRREAGKGILRALRKNEIVALMIDQDARKHGVFVPFFGRSASTFKGVGTFALKMDPTVLMMHTWRRDDLRIGVTLEEIEVKRTGDFDHDLEVLTAEMTAKLEGYIRLHPEQWLWLHRRWKTKPPTE